MFEGLKNKLGNMFGKKKEVHRMPYRRGFVQWTKYGYERKIPEKKIVLLKGNEKVVLPYFGDDYVEKLEREMRIPIFDMTSGEPRPSAGTPEIVDPAKMEYRRF